MVRLKANGISLKDCDTPGFQFLMVRLKGVKISVAVGLEPTFQFLMVRLKESSYEISDFRDRVISIPYGAIKR